MGDFSWFIIGGIFFGALVLILILWWFMKGAPSASRLWNWLEREWNEIKGRFRS